MSTENQTLKRMRACKKCGSKTERRMYCQKCADDPGLLTKRELQIINTTLRKSEGRPPAPQGENNHRELVRISNRIADYIWKAMGPTRDSVEWSLTLRMAAQRLDAARKPMEREAFHRDEEGVRI